MTLTASFSNAARLPLGRSRNRSSTSSTQPPSLHRYRSPLLFIIAAFFYTPADFSYISLTVVSLSTAADFTAISQRTAASTISGTLRKRNKDLLLIIMHG
ncbi:hypothetical protein C4D60_Mb06t15330 [Musa balbisiana]|uniref:Uncharacterized protein n=1 Tax=Musa balbisiana TaxID=52838 RepID=A0A4V4H3X6_MUSBA|nr:hypothetical protein C4D60_Mb06t15330 [Musa balbisiana]